MCQYCEGESVKYQENHLSNLYINSFGRAKHLVVEINICPPFRAAYPINFCPNCGKDLRYIEVSD